MDTLPQLLSQIHGIMAGKGIICLLKYQYKHCNDSERKIPWK